MKGRPQTTNLCPLPYCYVYARPKNRFVACVKFPEGYQKSGSFYSLEDAMYFVETVKNLPENRIADLMGNHWTETVMYPDLRLFRLHTADEVRASATKV